MKKFLKVLSLFSIIGIIPVGTIIAIHISIVLKNDTNSSKKTRSKDIMSKNFGTKILTIKKILF